jgi:tRNA threonylcarbamoyl adenosine modification protein YeaZ
MAVRIGLDASQPYASCAVSTESGIVAALSMERPIENFPELIRSTLSKAQISLKDLDEIVVCIGPGSQTGVRCAVVTGNALALATGKPVTGVLTTDAAAVLAPPDKVGSIAVPAGRSRWYIQSYGREGDKLCPLGEMQLLDDMPADSFSVFHKDPAACRESELCAYGILVAAAEQRQLIGQSLLEEVVPYERSEDSAVSQKKTHETSAK